MIKIRIFEKKPIKGGTPAIENKIIEVVIAKNELNLKSLNEYNVLVKKLTYCCKIQNKIIIEMLYINK